MSLLQRRVALVTGGARGLGRAVAASFSQAGASGLRGDLAGAIAEAPEVEGFDLVACDVTDEASIAAAIEGAVARFGRLDCVVANAGLVPPWSETEALDLDLWHRVMAVNAAGVAATLKHAVPALRASGGGSIVVMASVNAVSGHARQMLYTASKHAALGIVRAAAQDLGRHAIRVNAVAPGPIATEALLDRISARAASGTGPETAAALSAMSGQTALGRLATQDEVAKAVLFLASDLSSGITGQILPVDAGLA